LTLHAHSRGGLSRSAPQPCCLSPPFLDLFTVCCCRSRVQSMDSQVPSYLECSGARNRAVYERFGFQVSSPARLPGIGVGGRRSFLLMCSCRGPPRAPVTAAARISVHPSGQVAAASSPRTCDSLATPQCPLCNRSRVWRAATRRAHGTIRSSRRTRSRWRATRPGRRRSKSSTRWCARPEEGGAQAGETGSADRGRSVARTPEMRRWATRR
jgi:hypothetical protein